MSKTTFSYTQSKKFKVTLACASGIFMFFFLLFFQPFGVNNYRPDEKITLLLTAILIAFSLVVVALILVLELIIRPRLFKDRRLSTYILWLLTELLIVCTATFMFYNAIGGFHDFLFGSYIKHVFEMSSILIIPFVGTHFYFKHTEAVKEYEAVLSISKDEPNLDDVVLLSGDYKKDQIALPLKHIVFIESEDNYASLNYLEDGLLKKYLIRSTLTSLEKKLSSNSITRINRSTIVNLYHLASFKHGSGKFNLKLNHTSEVFTVSKSNHTKLHNLLA